MKTKMIFAGLALLPWLAACVDDEGNYHYVEVNEISVTGIDDFYSVLSQIDEVHITPQIEGSLAGTDTDNYEYTWYTCTGGVGSEEQGIGPHEHTVLGREKDLHCKIDLKPYDYTLYLSIKDKATDLAWSFPTGLSVGTPVTKGFLVLGETADGKGALDMLAMPANRDTTMLEDVFDNSELALTRPEKLLFAGPRGNWAQTLWMMTGEGSFRLTNGSSFDLIAEFNDNGLIETEFEHKRPMRVKDMFPRQTSMRGNSMNRSAMYRGYITEDLAVLNMVIQGEYFSTPFNRYSPTSSQLFKPYPLAFCAGVASNAYNGVMLYDMDANKFAKANGTSASYCTLTPGLMDYPGDPFPWDQKDNGRTILYGENGFENNQGNCYALMKDPSGKYFIYSFKVSTSAWQPCSKLGCYEIDPAVVTGFDQASLYAFSSVRTALMYAVGSKLYVYDYARKLLESRDLGAEITYLEAEYCSTGSVADFLVATFNGTEGVIRKLEVGSDPNRLEIKDKPREVWKTRLKVKDMEWKNAN